MKMSDKVMINCETSQTFSLLWSVYHWGPQQVGVVLPTLVLKLACPLMVHIFTVIGSPGAIFQLPEPLTPTPVPKPYKTISVFDQLTRKMPGPSVVFQPAIQ